jgi:3-methyl-2-oxobutanoate hydroxymethyltransferase
MNYSGSSTVDLRYITTMRLQEMKDRGQKIVCLTAYDALIARILDEAGVDLILVGDSLGNVFQGHETTIPVTLEDTIYHTKAVVRGASRALIVADMPFMSFQVSAHEAFTNAGRIMKEAGAAAVKLEGGKNTVEAISRMTDAGIPVMGHLGLTPQSIHKFGTYRTRGKDPKEAETIFNDAHLLEEAGAFSIVLEKIPAELAKKITESLKIPTIGIGAGGYCDGQILVYTDMLGLTVDFSPRFVRRYAQLNETIINAVKQYGNDVREKNFPTAEESY